MKWKHFPRYWPFVRGIHRSRWIPRTRPVTQSFDVFRARINDWVNTREAGDLRCHRCHYDVDIMRYIHSFQHYATRSLWRHILLSLLQFHYNDVIMSSMVFQITSLAIVYSTVNSGTFPRKYQSSASLAFAREIHRWPVNSPHKGPITRKMFPFDDVIMFWYDIALTMLNQWYSASIH